MFFCNALTLSIWLVFAIKRHILKISIIQMKFYPNKTIRLNQTPIYFCFLSFFYSIFMGSKESILGFLVLFDRLDEEEKFGAGKDQTRESLNIYEVNTDY